MQSVMLIRWLFVAVAPFCHVFSQYVELCTLNDDVPTRLHQKETGARGGKEGGGRGLRTCQVSSHHDTGSRALVQLASNHHMPVSWWSAVACAWCMAHLCNVHALSMQQPKMVTRTYFKHDISLA